MYLLIIVVNNVRKLKTVIKTLNDIGIKGATIVDSMGGGNYFDSYFGRRPIIGSAIRTISEKSEFNKTVMSVVYCKKHVLAAMDAIEEILGGDMQKPNTGIIFTIPLETFKGGALERHLNENQK